MKQYELVVPGQPGTAQPVLGWPQALHAATLLALREQAAVEVWVRPRQGPDLAWRKCTVFPTGAVHRERPLHRRPQLGD